MSGRVALLSCRLPSAVAHFFVCYLALCPRPTLKASYTELFNFSRMLWKTMGHSIPLDSVQTRTGGGGGMHFGYVSLKQQPNILLEQKMDLPLSLCSKMLFGAAQWHVVAMNDLQLPLSAFPSWKLEYKIKWKYELPICSFSSNTWQDCFFFHEYSVIHCHKLLVRFFSGV